MKLNSDAIQLMIAQADAQVSALVDPLYEAVKAHDALQSRHDSSALCASLLREMQQTPRVPSELPVGQPAVYFAAEVGGDGSAVWSLMNEGALPLLYHPLAAENPGFPKPNKNILFLVRIFWGGTEPSATLYQLHLESLSAIAIGLGRNPVPVSLHSLAVVTS